MKKLVIVESPTKAKTIGRFLGDDFIIESSYGHVRDLPKSKIGIDLEKNFAVNYIIPKKSQTRVTALRKIAQKCTGVILATDADREGEAIAWHLGQVLGLMDENGTIPREGSKTIERIVFHEITDHAVREALAHPRALNFDLVNAQQGRRVLDRIVGYQLSPFLWKKISRGLSAGRVQSVALRLIADREAEINAFQAQEYWSIGARYRNAHGELESQLTKINGESLDKLAIAQEARAQEIVRDLTAAPAEATLVETKPTRKNPLPPFTTSTLQQTAAKRLGLSSKKTMYLAQQLYENGLITYMRTDAVNLSQEALTMAHQWIEKNLGKKYATDAPRRFKNTSRLAQEAHEAIRPTDVEREPSHIALGRDEKKLYDLIWRRFVASQLPPAEFATSRIEITARAKAATYLLTANGSTMQFDGFLKIWPTKFEEKELPPIVQGESLALVEALPEQHFTEPPARYNEASLIKTLEQFGIGRPSTYAPTISVIQERNYVEKIQGRFHPTEMGLLVNKVLTENFPEIVDVAFTAKMEEELDQVAEGAIEWQRVIKEFYDPFSKHLTDKYETVIKKDIVPEETTDQVCEKCGKPMVIKFGRFGKFMACSGFPDCKNAKPIKEPPKSSGVKCPKCLASAERKDDPGELIERRVRKGRVRGKLFWGCAKFPGCDYAVWNNPVENPPTWSPEDDEKKKERGKKYQAKGKKKQ